MSEICVVLHKVMGNFDGAGNLEAKIFKGKLGAKLQLLEALGRGVGGGWSNPKILWGK